MHLSTDLVLTSVALFAAAVAVAGLLWLERRPHEPGRPRLLPTTPLLFLCLLAIILALAHLMTIVTGVPHVGRLSSLV